MTKQKQQLVIIRLILLSLWLSVQIRAGEIKGIVTWYCPCKRCTGPTAPNRTASGAWPKQGRTIAAPRKIPFNTRVQINGHEYIVEDRTSRRYDGRWDIFMRSHAEAKQFGKQWLTITWEEP